MFSDWKLCPSQTSGVNKLVAIQSTVRLHCWKNANVNAYDYTRASMCLVQPVAWLPHAGFMSSLKLTFTSATEVSQFVGFLILLFCLRQHSGNAFVFNAVRFPIDNILNMMLFNRTMSNTSRRSGGLKSDKARTLSDFLHKCFGNSCNKCKYMTSYIRVIYLKR